MAHGFKEIKQGNTSPKSFNDRKPQVKSVREGKGIGSRRMFSTQFKLQVLDSYRQDADCRGNQRATARKYGIHRRQIQKWLQMESSLRCSASESGEVALNLVGQSRQQGGTCRAGCLPPEPAQDIPNVDYRPISSSVSPQCSVDTAEEEEEELNVDKISDSEDEVSSGESVFEQEQALDFTCAALSRRRFYSLNFKLEVLDAFYNDRSCCGNQRATALKFGVHRRQIQKWLNQEGMLRGEYASAMMPSGRDQVSVYRPDLVSPSFQVGDDIGGPPAPTMILRNETHSPCLDLSRKRKSLDPPVAPEPKKMYLDLDAEKPTSAQETALCLVKPTSVPSEVTSTLDLYRPQCQGSPTCPAPAYWVCCEQAPPPYYDCWSSSYTCPYAACITSRLHNDAHYYKQAIKDINLYSPLYT